MGADDEHRHHLRAVLAYLGHPRRQHLLEGVAAALDREAENEHLHSTANGATRQKVNTSTAIGANAAKGEFPRDSQVGNGPCTNKHLMVMCVNACDFSSVYEAMRRSSVCRGENAETPKSPAGSQHLDSLERRAVLRVRS